MHRQWHILLAEDEVINAIALAESLKGAGFRVTITHNGLQALEAESRDPADALVTDLHMPQLGGVELIRRLRVCRPEIPVVIMTGHAIPPELLTGPGGLTMGVAKPVSTHEVRRALQSVLPPRNGLAGSAPVS